MTTDICPACGKQITRGVVVGWHRECHRCYHGRDCRCRDCFAELYDDMNADEMAVAWMLCERIDGGRADYGGMKLADDERDLDVEAGEELADAMIYRAMRAVQRLRRGSKPRGGWFAFEYGLRHWRCAGQREALCGVVDSVGDIDYPAVMAPTSGRCEVCLKLCRGEG